MNNPRAHAPLSTPGAASRAPAWMVAWALALGLATGTASAGPAHGAVNAGTPAAISATGTRADTASPGGDAAGPGADAAVEFDTGMLAGSKRGNVDLSRFEKGVTVLPGIYNVDVYLNQQWVGRMNVRLAAPDPDANAAPCFTRAMLERMQLTAQVKADEAAKRDAPDACVPLDQLIPGARVDFDLSDLRLNASVPQALLGNQPRGYVDPSSWDEGIPAFLLNYRLNTYRSTSAGIHQTSAYLGLNAGLNIGPWHLRQDSTLTWQSGTGGMPSARHWHNIDAYVRRDLPSIRSTLTLGDSYTDGAVFDSFGLRGVQLASDDRMLPQSRRGYAPVVRGTADTNARVTVRQNGVELLETTVPPGPFVIDDLYPTGYGGDLDVTVTEADGRQHSFRVPYASVAQLQRPGITRYDVAVGRLRNLSLGNNPRVAQGTIQHGFNNRVTGYAGVQASDGYVAALIGGALNTRAGAFALDITEAKASIPGLGSHSGQSARLSWNKIVTGSDTRIGVSAYRYSTSGFLSLTDAARVRHAATHGANTPGYLPGDVRTIDGVPFNGPLTPAQRAALQGKTDPQYRQVPTGDLLHQRNRFSLTLSQPLGESGGQLYANVSFRNYWNRTDSDTGFQIGYSNHIGRLNYGLSAARTRDYFGRRDTRISLNFSLPLGSSPASPNLTANLTRDTSGGTQEQAMLSGTAGRHDQFNYGATVSHGNDGSGNAASIQAGYRGPWAIFGASYGKGTGYSQTSFNMSGALIAHRGGVTFGQPMGDTVALVHAPGAAGAHIQSAPGVTVDHDGYALVPYLTPYQMDTIRIDTNGLPLGTELAATSANVAPYAGAVALVKFKTRYGRALVASIDMADGKPAPFGAEIQDAQGNPVGTVGQAGRALLRVHRRSGTLTVRTAGTDEHAATTCHFTYHLAEHGKGTDHRFPSIHPTCVSP